MTDGPLQKPVLPALLPDRDAYRARLQQILPRAVTGTAATDSPVAAGAALAMMYVGAIDGFNPIRPITVLRMSVGIASRRSDDDRRAYMAAALHHSPNNAIDQLCDSWDISRRAWYQANSREGQRDETLPAWASHGALLIDPDVAATSSRGRYTLAADFAALLDPDLAGAALDQAIIVWQQEHLGPIGKSRHMFQQMKAKAGSAVTVTLPEGTTQNLDPGLSSLILKTFIESAAPALLGEPHVIFISQSGQPVGTVDTAYLKNAGLLLERLNLLPDCLLVDTALNHGSLWFVEVVATDGPVHEARRTALLEWAIDAGVSEHQCKFVTAFESRSASPAKKALPVLASGTYAWFADEPESLLRWDAI